MPFTVQELENISVASLDFHMRGDVHKQSIQDKPLLREMKRVQKAFPGGKGLITKRVKFDYTTDIQGFSGDDQVSYSNPANLKQASYPWKEIHTGIGVSLTELKHDGISVVNSAIGAKTSMHDEREKTALANLLEDKLEDMSESYSRGMNNMYWKDGTQDAKQVAGIQSIILNDPTTATIVGGIDQQANTLWRNRASLNLSTGTPSDLTIVKKLTSERRQLRRFGGRPKFAPCGSDFLDALEAELRAKGTFTQEGWSRQQTIDIGIADLELKDIKFFYDPTLDDLGLSKFCYILDTMKGPHPRVMVGEDDKTHAPARPEDRYVIYRAVTWTGGMVCWQRNANGVYSIA